MTDIQINQELFQAMLQSKVKEVAGEPEYSRQNNVDSYMADNKGEPVVRVAVANFSPDLDIWQHLRSPALVGRYPLSPADIWEHYAAANFKRTRPDGSASLLALPETFENVLARIRRIVIVCGMLVVNPEIYTTYAQKIDQGDDDPFDYYKRATIEVSEIVDKAIGKLALSLMAPKRAVVPMTAKSTEKIIDRTRGEYRKESYHGPCNNHWPQNSIAVMTGLLRFGIHHLPFRDEVDADGNPQRLYGRYRSIVIFDEHEPVSDNTHGISRLDQARLAVLHKQNDYTDSSAEAVAERYCTYNQTKKDGKTACRKCIAACPSNALANSTPNPNGVFSKKITAQKHRFWEDTLAFDFKNCCSDRYQKAELYEDYVCARCEAICAARGIRKSTSALKSINQK
jgi:hypothetical protein